jgi:hypothetical protein
MGRNYAPFALKESSRSVDQLDVDLVECRQCGEEWPREELVDVAAGRGCTSCAGSPLCAECGHARKEHFGTFGASRRGCGARDFDLQTLGASSCSCRGFVRRTGVLADAPFAEPDELPPLRIVPLDA